MSSRFDNEPPSVEPRGPSLDNSIDNSATLAASLLARRVLPALPVPRTIRLSSLPPTVVGMERLNEKLGDACAGGGFGRRQFGVDDCSHALIEDLVQQGASIRDARALFLAASNGQPETIKLLLRVGGRRLVNEQDEHPWTSTAILRCMWPQGQRTPSA